MRAVYPDARNPFSFPELLEEGLDPFSVRELWVVAHPQPNVAIDITEAFGRKMAALRCHESQIKDPEEVEGFLHARLERSAQQMGLGDGRLAETFRVVLAP